MKATVIQTQEGALSLRLAQDKERESLLTLDQISELCIAMNRIRNFDKEKFRKFYTKPYEPSNRNTPLQVTISNLSDNATVEPICQSTTRSFRKKIDSLRSRWRSFIRFLSKGWTLSEGMDLQH